jgi:penicillin-binding protein 1C
VKRWLRRGAIGAAALLAALVALRLLPRAPLAAGVPLSAAVYDRHGRLLRLALAADQQYRVWTPLPGIAPGLVQATLLYEDRHFRAHPGVDPLALARAALATALGRGRPGGSTLTMQLARRLYRIPSHTVSGKLRQVLAALWLEARYSKRALLEAYLNLVPYGGNVEGVGAASLIYFRKEPRALLPGEAATLAVIPQNPTRRGPRVQDDSGRLPAALVAARATLLARWTPGDTTVPAAVHRPGDLPFLAPHFVEGVIGQGGRITTTLDLPLQRLLERHVRGYVARNRRSGLDNAAVLLVDHQSLAVRAAVGSADFFDARIAGQVDGTRARRSPGSALKPFVYALGLEQGVIHPATMLRDVPRAFGAYSPENFDGRFAGPLPAREALVRSRNVPALAVAAQLDGPTLFQFLRTAGVGLTQPETHYGLGLVLGTGEVSMEELVTLYAALANQGMLAPLRTRESDPVASGTRVLSPEASWLVLDMLEGAIRPGQPLAAAPARTPVAWKTGTSWGFRDAWTVGVFGRWVMAVWLGNFSGEGNPAFVGVQAAAPLFFEIVDSLAAHDRAAPVVLPRRVPPPLRRVPVCALSGGLPTPSCPHTRDTWFIPGRSPIEPCHIHRTFLVDARGRRSCAPAQLHPEVFEVWPSDLARLFAAAGLPRRMVPPLAPGCAGDDDAGQAPRITSPLAGVTYTLRPELQARDAIGLQAAVDGDADEVFWFADETFIGRARGGATLFWRPPPGRFLVRAVDERGRADARPVRVEVLR